MSDMEKRVEQLERRATHYRNALVLLVIGLCAVGVVGFTTDDGVIRGRSLELTDDEGEFFSAYSAMGTRPVITFRGGVSIQSNEGKRLMWLGADKLGDGYIFINTKNGDSERLITVGSNGVNGDYGGFAAMSRSGHILVWAGGADGAGLLNIASETGTLITARGNSTGFLLDGFNKTGEGVVQLGVDDYGNGYVGAYNRKGVGRTLKPGP